MTIRFVASLLGFALVGTAAAQDANARCAALSKLQLKDATITLAEEITHGSTKMAGGVEVSRDLPSFCRVMVTAKPVADSNIGIEVWLPEDGWNQGFVGTGNGGGAGGISRGDMGHGLLRGYATANTAMGTTPNANLQVDHPERWADFGYRATHEMTWIGKALIASYYGKGPAHSYFVGCSTGGEQALSEAERYPDDYNGILAGAPANNRTHLHTSFLWNWRAAYDAEGKSLLPASVLKLVADAVLKACAGKDGGAANDQFLTDPRSCHFGLESLPRCNESVTSDCVTEEQLQALIKVYHGPINPRTGERIYTPLFYGSEQSIGQTYPMNANSLPGGQFYPFRWAFGKDFNPNSFDFDHDLDKVDATLAPVLNANMDLSAFQKAGGKLIMYGGTADSLVPMPDAINFYERAIASSGSVEAAQRFFRYFTVPGMGHCGGGPGLNDIGQSISGAPLDAGHNVFSALVDWVEKSAAPETIVARRGHELERPVCAYPKFPEFKSGDSKAAVSYACVEHPRGRVPAEAARYLK